MKVRDVIKIIEADGWYQVSMRGDHRQYKHSTKKAFMPQSDTNNDENQLYFLAEGSAEKSPPQWSKKPDKKAD